MSNLLVDWWRSRQFSAALKKGNTYLAQQLLEETQRTGARLSLLERVFRDRLQSDKSSAQYEREVLVLREQISQALQTIEKSSTDKQQFEQFLADVRNQLRQKEQELVSIQQQLQASRQEIQGLHDQLKQKEQEVVSTKQQLEAHGREITSIQQQLVARGQEIEALYNQLSQREQEIASIQQQVAVRGREIDLSQQQIVTRDQELQSLRNQLNQASQSLVENLLLPPHQKFIKSVEERFRLNEISENLLQCTGINEEVFYELEENLVNYLKSEFERYPSKEGLSQSLKATHYKDIVTLQRGQDPHYNSYLSPHVYFMVYFLAGVYSAYLAWFLVYKSELLRSKVNILDIGAGSGAIIYGLFFLLSNRPIPHRAMRVWAG